MPGGAGGAHGAAEQGGEQGKEKVQQDRGGGGRNPGGTPAGWARLLDCRVNFHNNKLVWMGVGGKGNMPIKE